MGKDEKLISLKQIFFSVEAKNQKEVFQFIAQKASELKIISNQKTLITDFLNREKISSTGFEDGFALPHAKNDDILKPVVFILRLKNSVQWNAVDGKLTNFIVAIMVPKQQVSDIYLDIIANISTKLVDKELRNQLKVTRSKNEVINLLFTNSEDKKKIEQSKEINLDSKKIVGISSCTTGVVHTYMCKELLEKAGTELGYKVHIETQGQKGQEYVLSQQEIDEADVVILANDVAVELDRFIGKKVYRCGTKPVVKDANQVIKDALEKGSIYGNSSNNKGEKHDFILSSAGNRTGILKHLLSGVSFMIPFVVFAGLVFAIDNGIAHAAFGNKFGFAGSWADQLNNVNNVNNGYTPNNLMHVLFIINSIANIGFTLMIPIMGAYIAYSIAGRAGIAPAMIVTFLLVTPGDNLWWGWGVFNLSGSTSIDATKPFAGTANISWTLFGALYGGLICGYLVRYVNSWNVPKWLAPIMPIIIIPLFCTAFVAIPTAFFVAAPFGYVMGAIDYGLSWMGLPKNADIGFLVGLILGAMVGFDMGGPVNKTAVLVATSLMVQDGGRLMGPVAAAIPIAPLGCALTSTVLGRKMFNKQEKSLGVNAWLLGFMGISESAIPFAARDTWRTILANVIGSAVAGALAFVFSVQGHVGAWGSFIIVIFGGVTDTSGSFIGIIWYIIAIVVGTIVQSLIYTSLLLHKNGSFNKSFNKLFAPIKNVFVKNDKVNE